ncbi:MAG TPA: TIGR02466 family protein [Crenalkalicoccus sp.]|jgi:uncharacterized protein (TIGR02466 family)|nr:TIGR02466 family protein [Crenalkalicoccus sp.]
MDRLAPQGLELLFASPLLRFAVREAAALNARLLAEIAAMRRASPGLARSNQHGWHSETDFFHRAEPGCAALRTHILEALRQATLRVAPEFDFAQRALQVEGWVNVNGQGGYNTPHDHPGWAWSGSYYVAQPEATGRSGMIEFLDPRTNVAVVTVERAACFLSKAQFRPPAGEIIVFPAYLKHWVYPNEQAEERVSVAFNARFAPRK